MEYRITDVGEGLREIMSRYGIVKVEERTTEIMNFNLEVGNMNISIKISAMETIYYYDNGDMRIETIYAYNNEQFTEVEDIMNEVITDMKYYLQQLEKEATQAMVRKILQGIAEILYVELFDELPQTELI